MSLQNALIGMEMPVYECRKKAAEHNIFGDENLFEDEFFEVSNN